MKKSLNKKNSPVLLLLASYAAGLLLFVLFQLLCFAQNRIAYANGTLMEKTLAVADFNLQEMEIKEDGSLLCLGGDPQLILKDQSLKVENISLDFSYSMHPLLVNVFWAKPGQSYSLKQMAYPQKSQSGVFLLPAAGGQNLRVDPGTKAGNRIVVNSIVVNQKRAFYLFFVPSAGQVIVWVLGTGLAACTASLLPLKSKKAGDKGG